MQLKDVMSRPVEVISPEASLEEAARKMDQLDVGPLPVCAAADIAASRRLD